MSKTVSRVVFEAGIITTDKSASTNNIQLLRSDISFPADLLSGSGNSSKSIHRDSTVIGGDLQAKKGFDAIVDVVS